MEKNKKVETGITSSAASEGLALRRCKAIRRRWCSGAGEKSPCTRELPPFVEGLPWDGVGHDQTKARGWLSERR